MIDDRACIERGLGRWYPIKRLIGGGGRAAVRAAEWWLGGSKVSERTGLLVFASRMQLTKYTGDLGNVRRGRGYLVLLGG